MSLNKESIADSLYQMKQEIYAASKRGNTIYSNISKDIYMQTGLMRNNEVPLPSTGKSK